MKQTTTPDQDSVEMQNEQAEREMRTKASSLSTDRVPKDKTLSDEYWDKQEADGQVRFLRSFHAVKADGGDVVAVAAESAAHWNRMYRELLANTTTQATSGSEPNPSRREQMLTEMRDGLDQEAADNFRDTELSALLNRYTDPCEGECDHSQCPLLRDLRSLVESERIREVLRTARDKVKPIIDAEKEGEQVGDLMNIQLRSSSPYINPAGDETKSLGSVEEKNLGNEG